MSLGDRDFHFKRPGGGKGASKAPFQKKERKETHKNNNSIHIVCLNVYCLASSNCFRHFFSRNCQNTVDKVKEAGTSTHLAKTLLVSIFVQNLPTSLVLKMHPFTLQARGEISSHPSGRRHSMACTIVARLSLAVKTHELHLDNKSLHLCGG